jgi:hypothetical protein
MSRLHACLGVTVALAFMILVTSISVSAQGSPSANGVKANTTGNTADTTAGTTADTPQVTVPGSATASVTNQSAGAGATVGVEIWKKDHSLLGVFFTFAPASTLSGAQGTFGSFLLNPPASGTSLSVVGNHFWGLNQHGQLNDSCQSAGNCALLIGAAVRGGITNTTWSTSDSTPQSAQGYVAYLTPAVTIASRTISYGDAAATNAAAANEVQFGLEIGPTFRIIGGDLGQMSALRQSLLGTSVTSMTGFDVTLWARLNTFRPFVRISKFSNPAGTAIPGLTGGQAIFGIDVLAALFQVPVK